MEMAVQGAMIAIVASTALAETNSVDEEQENENGAMGEDTPPPPPPPPDDSEGFAEAEADAAEPAPPVPEEPVVVLESPHKSPEPAGLAPLELDMTAKIYQVKKKGKSMTLEVTPMSLRLMQGKKVAENLLYEHLQSWEAGSGELIVLKTAEGGKGVSTNS